MDLLQEMFGKILRDDFYLIIDNGGSSNQTIQLFDNRNFPQTTEVVSTYTATIPSADFSLPAPVFFVSDTGLFQTSGYLTVAANELSLALAQGGAPTLTWQTIGSNEVYSYNSLQSSEVGVSIQDKNAVTYNFVVTNSNVSNNLTVTLVNMNYSQFTNGLGSLTGYYFEKCSVYANSSTQAVKPLTLKKFQDVFGTQLVQDVVPILNPYASQPATYDIPLNMPMDGNNTIQYTINSGQRVIMKFRARAYDYLTQISNGAHVGMPTYMVEDAEPIKDLPQEIMQNLTR